MSGTNETDRTKASGGESPVKPAPPVPGVPTTPPPQERPLGPAPAVPLGGSPPAMPAGHERALGPAPAIPTGSGPERPIPGPAGASMPGGYPQPGAARPVAGMPSATGFLHPESPMAGPAGMTPAAPRPTAAQPLARPGQTVYAQPTQGQTAMPAAMPVNPMGVGYAAQSATAGPAQHGGIQPTSVAPFGTAPTAMPAYPYQVQPPSGPPPVPPPTNAPAPSPHTAPQPHWPAQPPTGPVSAAVERADESTADLPKPKTRKSHSLRRESQAKSSHFALMFLMCAAIFLVGVIIVLIISLVT